DEAAELTGAPPPESLRSDAPTLVESALSEAAGDDLYLVGLIGGKNVGKSSLINALVGRTISSDAAHGPGTQKVIAYVHDSRTEALRAMLDAEVPGRYELVTHGRDDLARQALLDLPDFDSHFEEHLEITRRMLRHLLYPVWMQSVEKYADGQPRELLLKVTAGNAPDNFLFVLNKADQLDTRRVPSAGDELREDYARRVAAALGLPRPPRVWLISAARPAEYDLPALRELLGRAKPAEAVARSRAWAIGRQSRLLMAWLDGQDLPGRRDRLARLEEQALEEIMAHVSGPLIAHVLPPIPEDRALRAALADALMQRRVVRWPIVNVLHVLLDPLVSGLRGRLPFGHPWAFEGSIKLVSRHLASCPRPLPSAIQAVFARLQQANPLVSRLYGHRRLWETLPAETAADELRQGLAEAVDHRKQAGLAHLGGGGGPVGWSARWLLTLGAAIWFPFAQPMLEALLRQRAVDLALLAVQVLGVPYLLKNVGFLCVYYVLLWLGLKWRTRRQADRWFERWAHGDPRDPIESLTGRVLEWSRGLTEPIRAVRERIEALLRRAAAHACD
ncbi:MAG: GTPase domain-containing protein, partial [Phycisphaerae bacterium]